MKRGIILTIGAIVVWILWIVATTYVRAPKLVAELGTLPISSASLPKSRLCSLLVIQDPTFFRHQGIGILDGKPGHTTVTQAVGKFLFFERFEPNIPNKLRLMLAAWAFDRRVSKEKQLQIFLSRAYFGTVDGRSISGFDAAARTYFEKNLSNLSDREFASLLAMLDGPNAYDPLEHAEVNARRTARIEERIRSACSSVAVDGGAQ